MRTSFMPIELLNPLARFLGKGAGALVQPSSAKPGTASRPDSSTRANHLRGDMSLSPGEEDTCADCTHPRLAPQQGRGTSSKLASPPADPTGPVAADDGPADQVFGVDDGPDPNSLPSICSVVQ
jgi:hypothetical protein